MEGRRLGGHKSIGVGVAVQHSNKNGMGGQAFIKGGRGGGSPPPLEIVLSKLFIDVDKCLTKCMSSESMHT